MGITPCTLECSLNKDTLECQSCGRTIEEIGGWSEMSNSEKSVVFQRLMKPIASQNVLDHGQVALVSVSGDDETPAMAARTSFGKDSRDYSHSDNIKLLRYLVSHRHTTPLEFCQATFYMKMPIFVARQWVRHRTASINEESGRYKKFDPCFYVPSVEDLNTQSKNNKQGRSEEQIDNPEQAQEVIREASLSAFDRYEQLLEMGVAKEVARSVLPTNYYTSWYWTCDAHNIMHLLSLRLDPHAQLEIRRYALAVYEQLKEVWPEIMWAFDHYVRLGAKFDRGEMDVLKGVVDTEEFEGQEFYRLMSHRQRRELKGKFE